MDTRAIGTGSKAILVWALLSLAGCGEMSDSSSGAQSAPADPVAMPSETHTSVAESGVRPSTAEERAQAEAEAEAKRKADPRHYSRHPNAPQQAASDAVDALERAQAHTAGAVDSETATRD